MAALAPPTPATTTDPDDRGLLAALVGDGRPLVMFTGMSLLLSGAFALFLSATGHFLPHDVEYLGMFPEELCAINECRIVHFMFHDRVSFGGAIIAVGMLYLWLAEFPLKAREPWAWWLLLVSGIVGFSSFLAYLGYGYLDTWHGLATLALLPCFVLGLARSYRELPAGRSPRCLLVPGAPLDFRSRAGLGRLLLLGTSVGLVGAGCTIMLVGMTTVFVPQDLTYMGMTYAEIDAVNPRLIPLIAHDRAGFGGGVACGGLRCCSSCGAHDPREAGGRCWPSPASWASPLRSGFTPSSATTMPCTWRRPYSARCCLQRGSCSRARERHHPSRSPQRLE